MKLFKNIFISSFFIFAFWFSGCTHKPATVNIGLFQIDNSKQQALEKTLSVMDEAKAKKIAFNFITLSETDNLKKASKKCDLVITNMGANVSKLSLTPKINLNLPEYSSFAETVPNSLKPKFITDSQIATLPLLINPFEVDIDYEVFKKTKSKKIQTWSQLEAFAESSKKYCSYPIVFSGKDPDIFLGILDAISEVYSGDKNHNEAVKIISSAKKINMELVKTLAETPEAPLYAATRTLARFLKNQYITKNVFYFTRHDVSAIMQAKNSAIVFTNLDEHRQLNQKAIARYKSIPQLNDEHIPYFPSATSLEQRHVVASLISVNTVTGTKASLATVKFLFDTIGQSSLSRNTGLGPAHTRCQTPDIESDDARFWVTACDIPITPFGDECFTTLQEKENFANLLKDYIIELSIKE